MADPRGMEDEWERKQAVAGAMVDFLEGWVVRELCLHFRTIAECLYSETPEHRLIGVLLSAHEPLSLVEIAVKCNVSKDMVYPHGRIRRALDRLQKRGMVVDNGGEGKPRYSLDRSNLKVKLAMKTFEDFEKKEGLVAVTLREGIGPRFD